MKIRILPQGVRHFVKNQREDIVGFFTFLISYIHKHIIGSSRTFEKHKNRLVKFFLMKRGRYNRPFLHLTTMVVLGIGVLVAPFLADTYPIFSSKASESLVDLTSKEAQQQSIIVGENVFATQISEKPRDKIIEYTVQKGDTLSTIAKKFGIDEDTIKWANDMTSDNIGIGDTLKILPVSGIAHKVASGDTVYTIAKKYDTEAQKIVDFPFNDFSNPETFSLISGQILIVPDGVKPSERPTIRRQSYFATGPAAAVGASGFTWPVRGGVSQFASWYHMALDITSDVGTPVVAAHSGTITKINVGSWDGGYGTNVIVDNGGGDSSLYAHMSGVNVSIGQRVTAGRTVVGWVGMTGRTTGPHLHFEIRKNGALVNPISYLQ
jgi:murein DD-endopeptidase MepM/ murein hydrolase activator NlpD